MSVISRAAILGMAVRTSVATLAVGLVLVTMSVTTNESELEGGIVETASIVKSARTVGISDNDMYWVAGDPAAISRRLDALTSLKIKNIRLPVAWSAIETARGQYDWTGIDNMVNASVARRLGILAVVNTTPTWARGPFTGVYAAPTNPGDYGNFLRVFAKRYGNKISAYEVWNEPNSVLGYQPAPDPIGYTALLKAAYPAIKAGAPSATVIGGVLGSTISLGSWALNPVDFVRQMYAAGARGFFNALSFHPYQNSTKFSQGGSQPNSPLNQVNAIRQLMVTNGDSAKKIWGTEFGLPTSVVGEQQQADYISDYLATWRTLRFAGPSFIYTLRDRNSADTSDPESTFGVFRDNWTPKPAAAVIK